MANATVVKGLTGDGKEVALQAKGVRYRICGDSEQAEHFKEVIAKGASNVHKTR